MKTKRLPTVDYSSITDDYTDVKMHLFDVE